MTVDDYEAVRALYEEPGMLAYMPSFFPAEEPEAYFESYVKNMYRFYDFGMYVLEDARTGRIIGHVGLGVEDGTESDGGRTAQTEESGRNDSRGSDRWEPEAPTVETGRQKSEETTGKTDRQASETETAVEDGIAVKEPIDARITLGYVISTPYRGKGLASFGLPADSSLRPGFPVSGPGMDPGGSEKQRISGSGPAITTAVW